MPQEQTRKRSPGCLTHIVLFVVAMAAVYLWQSPGELTGSQIASQERHFYVAAVQRTGSRQQARILPMTLARLKAGELDMKSTSFLLPPGEIRVDADHDHHSVKVLERHPEGQLLEYHHGNTREAVSRYRAFHDRIEPLSYRVLAHVGMAFTALLLLIPVAVTGMAINWLWKRMA